MTEQEHSDPLFGLLEGSSRTFALSIPLLPRPVMTEVTVAYLLFRIADTLEDELAWDTETKLNSLRLIGAALDGQGLASLSLGIADSLNEVELSNRGYTALMMSIPEVLKAFSSLSDEARRIISSHLSRTVAGMAKCLRSPDPVQTLEGVREYCYFVAGIVGEMLTDLFVVQSPSLATCQELRELAPSFGEALQLVNILRDSEVDASEGRFYVPSQDQRPALFAMAHADLRSADRYVSLLKGYGADPGIIAFNSLNLALARSTIELVQREGPGAKLSRDHVRMIHNEIMKTLRQTDSLSPRDVATL